MADNKRDALRKHSQTTPSPVLDMMNKMAAGVTGGNTSTLPVVFTPDKTIRIGDNFIIRETGLEIIGEIGKGLWLEFAQWMKSLDTTLQWGWGDLVVHADERRAAWIEAEGITETELESKYKELLESTGYSYSSLSKFASFARRFPPFRRRKGLTYSHHVEVASLTEAQQDALLDEAEANKWSRNDLRKAVQKVSAPAEASATDNTTIVPEVAPDAPALFDDDDESVPLDLPDRPLEDDEHWKALDSIHDIIRKRNYRELSTRQANHIRRQIATARHALSLLELELPKPPRAKK